MFGVHYICLALLGLFALGESAFTHSEQLDTNYRVSWNTNSTHIEFQVKVQTTGYFGFGVSVNGSMFPGDIVVGYWDQGKPVLNDYHTTGHMPPQMDNSQDWTLTSGTKSNNNLIFSFVRAMDTGDQDDIPFHQGNNFLIWALSDQTPAAPDAIAYHGATNRGTTIVKL